MEGDQQADLKVHGGPAKAVYVYPADYYSFWREQFPEMALPWGMFGENLTIWGLRDDAVYIGDQLQVGSAQLVVTEPRMPCHKLALKFGRDDILKRFFQEWILRLLLRRAPGGGRGGRRPGQAAAS